MFQVDDKIISADIIEEKFVCDLAKCKGYCCVHGESGAPLEDDEVIILDKIYEVIKPYLRPEGIGAIKRFGTSTVDIEKDKVTPLIKGMECAYAIFEDGIARCAIEKAYDEGEISFRKPVSCHLYPLRIKKYRDFEAVNYDRWSICDPAREKGKEMNTPVYVFIGEALKRKYGEEFILKLQQYSAEILQRKNGKE